MEKRAPSKARLFVALALPDEAREQIVAWQAQVLGPRRELRLVRAESLHVTLVFLGWVADDPYGHIRTAALGAGAAERPRLSVLRVKAVPPRRPRLWALDLADEGGQATQLQAALSKRLEYGGFYTPEKRPFWPHITVARLRRGARAPRLDVPPPAITFDAAALVLYRSHLSRAGSEYESLGAATWV